MALSNMLKEPRREITETLIGLVVVGGLVYVDVCWASYAKQQMLQIDPKNANFVWFMAFTITPIMLVLAIALLIGLLKLIHNIGDGICNDLAKLNLDPRPKTRYKNKKKDKYLDGPECFVKRKLLKMQ